MKRIQYLAYLWTVVITQTGFGVSGSFLHLERQEGESVEFSCHIEPGSPLPYGFYLKRTWLQPRIVFFWYQNDPPDVKDAADKGRLSISGDPSSHAVNVSFSQLKAADTDRYSCEFMVERNGKEDEKIPGRTEFFLYVTSDDVSVDVELVQTCVGGSAVLPCHTPNGEGLAVEGVSLKRQKGRTPVEVVYHSKQHHSSNHFPAERVQLSSAPSLHGITYNVTLQQLQVEDSALYSCQLLLHGRPDRSTHLERRTFFVSVQGEECGCSSSSALLYALSAAVGTLLLLLVGFVLMSKVKARSGAKMQPPPPVYEEMVGVQSPCRKLASLRLEEAESTEYSNGQRRKATSENHYESPRGGLLHTSCHT
uniref:Ig-like domain-containing protein n=1 Tax=Nothobranchius kuhntae TaxID=321403 RepID=A0A1A8IWL3_NOTKU